MLCHCKNYNRSKNKRLHRENQLIGTTFVILNAQMINLTLEQSHLNDTYLFVATCRVPRKNK